jgi:hypothetical protein
LCGGGHAALAERHYDVGRYVCAGWMITHDMSDCADVAAVRLSNNVARYELTAAVAAAIF